MTTTASERSSRARRRLAVLLGVALSVGAPLQFTPAAHASAIYNSSESGLPNPAYVRFVCGFVCSNDFTIPVGQSKSRPGKGGVFWGGPSPTNWGIGHTACEELYDNQNNKLTDHGWAELHDPAGGNNFTWHIFNDSRANTGNPGVNLVTGGGIAFDCG